MNNPLDNPYKNVEPDDQKTPISSEREIMSHAIVIIVVALLLHPCIVLVYGFWFYY